MCLGCGSSALVGFFWGFLVLSPNTLYQLYCKCHESFSALLLTLEVRDEETARRKGRKLIMNLGACISRRSRSESILLFHLCH